MKTKILSIISVICSATFPYFMYAQGQAVQIIKMDTEILEELKNLIVKETGLKYQEITVEARLDKDLGIYGDDAIELIVTISKKFNVDISKFQAASYIAPEGDPILLMLIRLFTKKKERRRNDLKISDLVKAILKGRLDDETING